MTAWHAARLREHPAAPGTGKLLRQRENSRLLFLRQADVLHCRFDSLYNHLDTFKKCELLDRERGSLRHVWEDLVRSCSELKLTPRLLMEG